MPIQPRPPADLAGLVEGFRQTFQAVIDLGRECSEADFAAPSTCPGWSLQDHLSHVAAVESYLEGARQPVVELSHVEHVRSEFTRWMEYGVQARRDRPGQEVVDELETLLQQRRSTLAQHDLDLETDVPAPIDTTMPLGLLMRLRLNDIWVHEQDLREALGRPGNLDSPGAASFVRSIAGAFPRIVAEDVDGLPEWQRVIVESTGPVTARIGVYLTVDDSGARVGHPLFTGEAEPGLGGSHTGDLPTTTIAASTDALTRRAAGRRTTEHTTYRVVGEQEVARRVLDALVITP